MIILTKEERARSLEALNCVGHILHETSDDVDSIEALYDKLSQEAK